MIARIAAMLLVLARVTHAAPPVDVTADQAVALYHDHSARLAAIAADVEVAAAELAEARVYPNPSIGFTSARTISGADTISGSQHAVTVDVPVLIGGQRGRREHAARARTEQARREVEASAAAAELEIRGLFASLQEAQERATTLAAAVEDARTVRTIVAGRSAAGASSGYAVERTDLAIAAIASRLDEARSDELSVSAELAGAVGLPGWHPRAIGSLQPSDGAATVAVDANHPRLAVELQAQLVARADDARARGDAIPTPSIELQAFATTDPSGLAIMLGASMPLPLFDRNQGAVARARAEARRTQLELTARATELDADLQRAQVVRAAQRDALARFQTDALQRLTKLRAMAESAYRSGQGGIVELLDALDVITDARLREIELRAAVVKADLAVRAASAGR